jgi:hypothetical protein
MQDFEPRPVQGKGSWTGLVGIILTIAPAIYVLSAAPVLRIAVDLGWIKVYEDADDLPRSWIRAYKPVVVAAEQSRICRRPIYAWFHLFGSEAYFDWIIFSRSL